MKAADLRHVVSQNTGSLAAAHRNLFGDNLPVQKPSEYRVFGYLSLFRVGEETSNEIDNLVLLREESPELRPTFERLIEYGSTLWCQRSLRATQAGLSGCRRIR